MFITTLLLLFGTTGTASAQDGIVIIEDSRPPPTIVIIEDSRPPPARARPPAATPHVAALMAWYRSWLQGYGWFDLDK